MESEDGRALCDLRADREALARRVVTPRWYHPALGGCVAVIVYTQSWAGRALVVPLVGAAAVIGVVVAMIAWYDRAFGVRIRKPVGARCWVWMGLLATAYAAGLAAAWALGAAHASQGWSLAAALAVGGVFVLVGPRYDDALRRALARPIASRGPASAGTAGDTAEPRR